MCRFARLLCLLVPAALAAEEKPILVLDPGGHTAKVGKVLFTPDGKELITVSSDKTIRVWDVATGETLRVIRPPIGEGKVGMLYTAALSPDGQTLAVGGFGLPGDGWGNIYLISLARGEIDRVLTGHWEVIFGLAFSADGRRLISGSLDKTARIWDAKDGHCEQVLRGHTNSIYGVAFSPNGTQVITASLDKTARIWEVATGKTVAVLLGHDKEVQCVAWSPDGQTIATGSYDQSIRFWDADGSFRKRVPDLGGSIMSVSFSADSRELLFTRTGIKASGNSGIVNLKSGKKRITFDRHTNTVYSGVFRPDGSLAATTGGDDSDTFIWRTEDGKVLQHLVGKGRTPWSAAWGGDGKTIAWGNTKNGSTIKATMPLESSFSLEELDWAGEPDTSFRRARASLGSISLEPTGTTTLAVKKGDSTQATLQLSQAYDQVRCFTLLPEDRAVVGSNFGLFLFDTKAGKQVGEFMGHTGIVWAVAPSLDNRLLLSASKDQTVRVWDPRAVQTSSIAGVGVRARKIDGGLEVTSIVDDGPAGRDGRLAVGDVIVGVAPKGEEFTDVTSMPLARAVALVRGEVGTPVKLRVRRGNDTREIELRRGGISFTESRTEPVLSLFFAGREWIAWTPEGYYACSAGGEMLMGWHVNRGKDKLAEFLPAAQFRKQFYRPDVIKLLLRTGSLEQALARADEARGVKTEVTEVARALPPVVEITAPRPGNLDKAETTITATAQSRGQHPVKTFKLLIDGQQLPGTRGIRTVDNPKLGAATASWTVTLEPGRHQLQVLAESESSEGISPAVEVRFGGEQPMLRKPRLVLLAVGVSDYQHVGVEKLNYAAGDAKALVDTLKTHSGDLFREMKVKLLVDKEATKDNILDGLDWMIRETTDEDYVILFYAGHGELDNAGNLYFLPVEADRGSLRRTAIRGNALAEALRDLPRSRRILILDACHAGAIGEGKRRSNAGATDDLVRDLLLPGYGTVVMCSSTGKEFSQESNAHRMGVFTLALTEALAGKGPKDPTGTVFTHHLHSYVCDRVKELTKGQQHPLMKNPDDIRSFPLSKPN